MLGSALNREDIELHLLKELQTEASLRNMEEPVIAGAIVSFLIEVEGEKKKAKGGAVDPKVDAWKQIAAHYGTTKRQFSGKIIAFVQDDFKRQVIFRDIAHAYLMLESNFTKETVVLAGGVVEELLRLYLVHKKVTPVNNNFVGYIEACEQHGLLKKAIQRVSDSVRRFRNLVHLSREQSPKDTISKATATGALSAVFTLASDF